MRKLRASIFLCIAALTLMWSCSDNTRKTPKGYTFTVIREGDGNTVKPGEIMIVDMAIVDENDSAWYDNRNSDYPEMIRISDPSKKETERGVTEVFRMLSKGDSIELVMRAKEVFLFMWKMDTPMGVDPESNFTYRIRARDVLDEAGAIKFTHQRDSIHEIHERERLLREEEERRTMEAELEAYNKAQIAKDTLIIDTYLKSKNVSAQKHPAGLRYIVKKKGEGPKASNGDLVSMKYSGQLLDGKEFDAGEFSFVVGNGDVIGGWDLIASQMQKGTVITVFIPSTLAYGKGGRGALIGPDAVLVFDMELLAINKR